MERCGQKWSILLALILVAGCSVRPANIELPFSHPANPQADSAPFKPPVNIFQSDTPLSQIPPGTESSMTQKHTEKPVGKHMDDQMDPMKMKAKPPNVPDMEKTGPGHKDKEHNP